MEAHASLTDDVSPLDRVLDRDRLELVGRPD
jgi:hypothetical protein